MHQEPPPAPGNSLKTRLDALKKAQEVRRRQLQTSEKSTSPPDAPLNQASSAQPGPDCDRSFTSTQPPTLTPNCDPGPAPRRSERIHPESATRLGLDPHRVAELTRQSEERLAVEEMLQAARAANAAHATHAETLDPEVWADDRTPPGSAYSWQEWCDAMDDGQGGKLIAFEVRNVAGESTLMTMERQEGSGAFESILFEGCLLLAPKAPTSHPGAVCGELKLRDTEFPWTYRVVRPASHRLDRAYLFGAKGWVQFNDQDARPAQPGGGPGAARARQRG